VSAATTVTVSQFAPLSTEYCTSASVSGSFTLVQRIGCTLPCPQDSPPFGFSTVTAGAISSVIS